jgi:peptidoglycan hydrolase-like protein with peptidoglycan-binding domain
LFYVARAGTARETYSIVERIMKKLLLTSIAVLSLAATMPATAQQGKMAPQQSDRSSAQQSSSAVSNISQHETMQAQQALNQKGFNAGKADGILGPRTRRALTSFQQNQGLQRSGRFDDKTLAALGVSQRQQQGQPSTAGQGGNAQRSGANTKQPPAMSK